ncbi:hypothetical protein KEM55_002946 [Ascosphaera atra]|nr:hypothetical protein KEM55_002946 [Ascosphaera atra]
MKEFTQPRDPVSAFESPTFGEDTWFHINQPVGSMSISPCGRDVVLASKEGLHIVDLDNPYSPPRYLPHHTPWEVADVQWSPFASRDSWVVSTSNQKALVWNLAMRTTQNSIEYVLHAHSRAITDINFSALHPDILATCAVDSFVHCWDLRTPNKPVVSFSDWVAGATQVKWSKHDPHVIASSHDRFLHIWDDRKGAYPLRTIEAHDTKIYGVDWNRLRPEAVVTCSLDKTIKFWNYQLEEDVPEKVIHTSYPVWRARNTPFGKGCLAMPQRGDSDLHLYSRVTKDDTLQDEEPVHRFTGHKGQVKEFVWRARGGVVDGIDERDFQLVSWGTDKELRLHKIEPEVLSAVDYEKGKSTNPFTKHPRAGARYTSFQDESRLSEPSDLLPHQAGKQNKTRPTGINASAVSMPYPRPWNNGGGGFISSARGKSALRADMNPISWMRGVKVSGWEVETLGDEITHVGEKFSKVAFESVNVGQRKATVSMHGPWGPDGSSVFMKVDIKFPTVYPRNAIPSFNVQKTSMMTPQLISNLSAGLKTIAKAHMLNKRPCLEPALRYLLGEHSVEESVALAQEPSGALKSPDAFGEESSDEDEDAHLGTHNLSMSSEELLRPVNANAMVPVAKACGALWTNDGRLICFFPPKKEKPGYFLESMGLSEMVRLGRSDKTFEAFGRLRTGSPGAKRSRHSGTGTGGAVTDDAASESLADYSETESSSGSSSSSDIISSMPAHFQAASGWRGGSFGFPHTRSADNSSRSLTGLNTAGTTTESKQNTIYIYNYEELCPSKRTLAERYQIYGNRPDVCAHNMNVAAELGLTDLANVWGLIKLMLESQTPIETHMKTGLVGNPALALTEIDAIDNGVDIRYNESMGRDSSHKPRTLAGHLHSVKMRWGGHPFGGRFLVSALFEYFERIGDVQMLAMLSCILYEPELNMPETRKERRPFSRQSTSASLKGGVPIARKQSDQPEQQMEQQQQQQTRTRPQLTRKKSSLTSPFTSVGKDAVFMSTSHSPSAYSPVATMGTSGENEEQDFDSVESDEVDVPEARDIAIRRGNATTYLSESPEQGLAARSGSQTGGLASSLSRSITLGQSTSLSPCEEGVVSKKKSSPGNSWGTFGWTTTSLFGKAATGTSDPQITSTANTSHPSTLEPEPGPPVTEQDTQPTPRKKRKGIKVSLKNQDKFDNFQRASVPLLSPEQAAHYRAYCGAYAHLLFIWDLPTQRKEVLKLDHIANVKAPAVRPKLDRRGTSALFRRKRSLRQLNVTGVNEGLDIERRCGNCGNFLHASSKPARAGTAEELESVNCPQCNPAQATPIPTSCTICGQVVRGMFTPCLNCGHVSCVECHQAWFTLGITGESNEEFDDPGCPTGCGCKCTRHTVVQVPMSATARPAAVQLSDSERDGEDMRTKRRPRSLKAEAPATPTTTSSTTTNTRHTGTTSNKGRKSRPDTGSSEVWQAPFSILARGISGGLTSRQAGGEGARANTRRGWNHGNSA